MKIKQDIEYLKNTRAGEHRFFKLFLSKYPRAYLFLNRLFWEKMGGEKYAKKMESSERHLLAQKRIEEILKNIEFDSLLEIGCGTGENLNYLKEKFPDKTFVGCDFSKSQLKKASRFPLRFDYANAENLPYADKSFDVILTIGCLVHIPKMDKVEKEIQRVGKKYLIILEEDFMTAPTEWIMKWAGSGWHFFHDYRNLFKEFEYRACYNDNLTLGTALQPHFYERL